MSYAIKMHKAGNSDVLKWEAHEPGIPGADEVLIRNVAVGVNFIDVYERKGEFPLPALPAIPGKEGAGVVEKIGSNVTSLRVGERVAYASLPHGAYAEKRILPASRLVKMPEGISFVEAAAIMLQGMTARYLLKGCYPVDQTTTLLIHAAAGGVGNIVCQWAKSLGATVIGTVGNQEKAEMARSNGCDYPVLYTDQDWDKKIMDITDNRGVDVVYDSVGKTTFMKSLDCIRPMGMMVYFGQASGPIDPFDVNLLMTKGCLFLTRPNLMVYTREPSELLAHANDLFDVVQKGAVKINIGQTYALKDAGKAHDDLENRKTKGASVLVV